MVGEGFLEEVKQKKGRDTFRAWRPKDFQSELERISIPDKQTFIDSYIKYGSIGSKYLGNKEYIRAERGYRNALIAELMHGANIKALCGEKPELRGIKNLDISEAYYYSATETKGRKIEGKKEEIIEGLEYKATKIEDRENDTSRTFASRAQGAIFSPGGMYIIYHTGKRRMNWIVRSEMQYYRYVSALCGEKYKPDKTVSGGGRAIVYYEKESILKEVLLESNLSTVLSAESGYEETYLLPYDKKGKWITQIITKENWKEEMLRAIIPEARTDVWTRNIYCDAYDGETNYLLFTAPNITGLNKFLKTAMWNGDKNKFVIIGFDYQSDVLNEVAGDITNIFTIPLKDYIEELDI